MMWRSGCSAQESVYTETMRYRKPNMSLWRSAARHGVGVIGENWSPPRQVTRKKGGTRHPASRRGQRYTKTELEFEKILMNLGDGVFRGKYKRAYPFKNWVLNFYLHEVGLGIDVDDGWVDSEPRRNRKVADCKSAGIVLVRFSKFEVFGNRKLLVDKLRESYREALRMSKNR